MRKEIGFRIRDMWYNLGKCTTWSPLLVLHAAHDEVFFILIPFNSIKFHLIAIDLSVCLEVQVDVWVSYDNHVLSE